MHTAFVQIMRLLFSIMQQTMSAENRSENAFSDETDGDSLRRRYDRARHVGHTR